MPNDTLATTNVAITNNTTADPNWHPPILTGQSVRVRGCFVALLCVSFVVGGCAGSSRQATATSSNADPVFTLATGRVGAPARAGWSVAAHGRAASIDWILDSKARGRTVCVRLRAPSRSESDGPTCLPMGGPNGDDTGIAQQRVFADLGDSGYTAAVGVTSPRVTRIDLHLDGEPAITVPVSGQAFVFFAPSRNPRGYYNSYAANRMIDYHFEYSGL